MKNSKMSIVIEEPIYTAIHDLAEKEGISMSRAARDLIKEALEIREDVVLAKFAEKRDKTFDRSKSLSHEKVWD